MSFNLTLAGDKRVVHRSLQLLIVQAQHAIHQVEAADNTQVEVNLKGDVSIHPTRGLQATSGHSVNGLEPESPADKPGPKMVTEA